MKAYPTTITSYEIDGTVQHTITTCKCGRKWRRKIGPLPKLVPVDPPRPFDCPRCGRRVSDNTVYF